MGSRKNRRIGASSAWPFAARVALSSGLVTSLVTGISPQASAQSGTAKVDGNSQPNPGPDMSLWAADPPAVVAAKNAAKCETRLLSIAELADGPQYAAANFTAPPDGTAQPVITPAGQVSTASPSTDTPPPADAPKIGKIKTTKNEISFSGDYFHALGNVTLPFGYSLRQVAGIGNLVPPGVISPPRSSDYIGGTLSYSYGNAWFIDASYAHGTSSGQFTLPGGGGPSTFTIDDDWYQLYVRYTFPSLRFTPFFAYLRAGASYVTADQKDSSTTALEYQQSNKAKDYLGNLGFGAGYSFIRRSRATMGVQLEGEGFYGRRQQKSQESLLLSGEFGPPVTVNNDLYGGIVRGTLHYEYKLGASKLFKLFADGGMEAKFTEISYPGVGSFRGGTVSEVLWGPYVKAGLRYDF